MLKRGDKARKIENISFFWILRIKATKILKQLNHNVEQLGKIRSYAFSKSPEILQEKIKKWLTVAQTNCKLRHDFQNQGFVYNMVKNYPEYYSSSDLFWIMPILVCPYFILMLLLYVHE